MPVPYSMLVKQVKSTTLDGMLREITELVLSQYTGTQQLTTLQIKEDVYAATCFVIAQFNAGASKEAKRKFPQTLYPYQIALIIARCYPVCCLAGLAEDSSPDDDPIVMYQEAGERKGLYILDELPLKRLISSFNNMITEAQIKEVMAHLRRILPHRERTLDKNLVAVENGVFDFEKKVLLPFPRSMYSCPSRRWRTIPAPKTQ